jgi:hypothetical protein
VTGSCERGRTQRRADPVTEEEAGGGAEGTLSRPAPTYPGRKPPLLAVKRPARPYKSAMENRFTVGNADGA